MKYTKYTTFNCQGLNNDNKRSSLADDFRHHQITVMMLQETRITGLGLHKITSSNGIEIFMNSYLISSATSIEIFQS